MVNDTDRPRYDLARCDWANSDPILADYHDHVWGVPEYDDRALFEKLILDGFQAGLSWLIILRKRENFVKAFNGFEPEKIARWRSAKIESLMQNEGIVRNRLKIEGTRRNARAYLRLVKAQGSFADFLWDFVDGEPIRGEHRSSKTIPTESAESRAMSKALKAADFTFVGPTICYAFMQAVGMVDDHTDGCFRRSAR